jgi:hypothetical protein
MMSYELLPGANPSEPVRPGAQGFGDWLTVSEAVTYCAEKGLARTQKTVRRWAHRSHLDPDNAEITVRREDVDNGFRWVIERTSLDRKIEQELEFEARRARENGEPVPTGADASGVVRTGALAQLLGEPKPNPSVQVGTGAHLSGPGRDVEDVITQLEARIDDLKSEVDFYRDELRDRRHTTTALTDVIEAFRLTAQTNATQALERAEQRARSSLLYGEGDNSKGDETGDAV